MSKAGTHVITDLEGSRSAIDDLVDAGCLTWVGDELDFVHEGDRLLFAGDICDRGPFTIRLVEALLSLRRRHPERVAWVFGNLDVKNLGLLRDLPSLGLETPGYADWLRARASASDAAGPGGPALDLIAADTLDRRIDHWLCRQGSNRAFEFHQRELSDMLGRPCLPLEAAQDFLARLQPGGSMFEFLRLGQVAIVHGNVLVDHGGVSQANMGFVPGATTRHADARAWIDALNRWAAAQITLIAQAIVQWGPGTHIPDALIRYADAIWDPTVGSGQGAVCMNDVSLVYPFRRRERGNLRAPDEASIAYLRRAGIDTEVVGHTPIGDVPGPLKVPGFVRLMADTSRRRPGAHSTITIDPAGGLRVRGQTSRGVAVQYRTSAHSTTPIGSVTREGGFTVVGRTRLPGGTKFLLSKYFDGYNIRDLVVDRAQLAAMGPLPAVARTALDDPAAHFERLVAELQRKGKRIVEFGQLEACLGHRTPVVVSGFAKFGQSPIADERVDLEADALVRQLGSPADCLIITGGTDNGFERAVHAAARAAGHRVLGFIQQGTIAGEVDLVDDVAFAGVHQDWSAPLLASLTFAAGHAGVAVFVGGGGVVTEGIDYARELGMSYVLFDRAPGVTGSGGASAQAAASLAGAERARHVVQSFNDLRSAIDSQQGEHSMTTAAHGPTTIPTHALDDLTFASAARVLPSLDRTKASRFVVPIPAFAGEALRYPASYPPDMRQRDGSPHPLAGQPHPKAGQPLEDWRGQPILAPDGGVPQGVVFFNYEDAIYQGVPSSGDGILIFDMPSAAQAHALQAWIAEHGGPAALDSVAQVSALLDHALHIGLDDRYNSDLRYVARSLVPVADMATGVPAYGLHLRANELAQAVLVTGPARVGSVELGAEGGVFLLIGTDKTRGVRDIRCITPAAFAQTYTRADGSPTTAAALPVEHLGASAASTVGG